MMGLQENEFRGIIQIDKKACKGCDGCKSVCPTGAIEGKYGANHTINQEKCIDCGQCLINCPFGAPIDTIDMVDQVMARLIDKSTTVVATIAPSVRVAIGEEFGMEPGTLATAKLYGALKQVGFKILDTNFTADMTIMEEGTELVEKLRHYFLGEDTVTPVGPLPQLTSCCPGWVHYAELNNPGVLKHMSSAKSPMMMAGALAKTYGAQNIWGVDPQQIYVVGIMPCTAKKFEASRPEFYNAAQYWGKRGRTGNYPDIDTVLTTRDLARLLKKLNIDLQAVAEITDADNPLAQYSGAGTIFGNTGGVMEAALRTAYFVITGQELPILSFEPVRGLNGVKKTDISLHDAQTGKDFILKVAVVNGIKENLTSVIEEVEAGNSPYHFIEIMNCPGGCVNGGGQPTNPMGTAWIDKYKALLPW
ncbi:MAG: hydA [Firmicutes bacterium]|nr:hydA [Bacillota bacterium]